MFKSSAILFFLKRVLANPRYMGAIMPSSKKLADCMAQEALKALKNSDDFIVEVGSGTGCVTHSLLEQGLSSQQLLCVELDSRLYSYMAQRFPNLAIIHGNAAHLAKLIDREWYEQVGAIVSSIPMLALSAVERHQAVQAYFSVLRPGGRVVQFTYGYKSPIARPGLDGKRVACIYANLPPATVWVYEKITE